MPYDRDNPNQANVSSANYYMLRAFPENFFETDNYTDVRNNKCIQECDVNRMITSECWSSWFVDYCMLSIRI